MTLFNRIRTPCIGVCSTGIGDSVCRGCKRFDFEIIQWNGLNESQKEAIDRRLAELLSRVVSARFSIVDVAILERQLELQQIPYASYRNPYCWLYELLRAGAGQIVETTDYGFVRNPAEAQVHLVDIRADIDREFYALSIAHYERYILANQGRAACVSP